MMPTPPAPKRYVILCDDAGRPTGSAEILSAHTGEGRLHLAFSVYVFSADRRRILIQQRSGDKMLWPLVWANACCSHPREGETAVAAGQRRLLEEMGFACDLTLGPAFEYRAADPSGRGVEHEYDVTLIGIWMGDPEPNPAEVAAWRWIDLSELRGDMAERPELYAPWFHLGLTKVLASLTGSGR